MKRSLLLILLVGFAFTSCERDGPIILRIANDMPLMHPKSQGIEVFAAYINEHSEGRIRVETFHDGVLGGPNEYLEAIIAGTIQAATIGTEFEPRAPIVVSWEVPFLFPSWDYVRKVADSDFAATLYDNFPAEQNVRAVGWIPQGRRLMMTNRPIQSMADFSGFRLRVPQIDLYLAVGRNLGANPIAVPLAELYTALEQGIVDGFELPHGNLVTGRFYEVLDYVLMTEHITAFHNMFINEQFFQSLDPELQDVVLRAGRYMTDRTFQIAMDFERDALDYLVSQGVTLITPSEEFRRDLIASQMLTRQMLFDMYPIVEYVVGRFEEIMAGGN
jgi:tripartite ATP-independent transporter DctP family solute receptor